MIRSLLWAGLLLLLSSCAPALTSVFERVDSPPSELFMVTVTANEMVYGARLTIIDGVGDGCLLIADEGGLDDSSCDLGDLAPGTYRVTGIGPVGEVACFVRYFTTPALAPADIRPVACEIT